MTLASDNLISKEEIVKSALSAVLALILVPVSVRAQHVLFEEDFESGVPATWTNVHLSTHLDPWATGTGVVDGSKDVFHEFFCTNGFTQRDNILLSPVIDLSAVTQAFVEAGQYQKFPLSRLLNSVEVTTDGGANYTRVYTETGMLTGPSTIKVDVSAWAGSATFQFGFRYQGAVANEWSIDNVRVTRNAVEHTTTPLVQGQPATYGVTGAAAGNSVFVLLSGTGAGPLPSPWGNLNVFPPLVFVPLIAGPSGNASLTFTVPNGVAGAILYSQAIEFSLPMATINITNSIARLIT